ncbi:MAG: alpha/beta fold hydrolase [Chloroflexota bacterium]|nr:alpha/beta fold hydrolase [Chloroflexota bacterium]
MLEGLKIASSVLAGLSILSIAGPVFGEMAATMAPYFSKRTPRALLEFGVQYEEVAFPTNDNLMLRGWFFPSRNKNAPAVLYAPATSRDQRSGISLVQPLHEAGYHVLLFSYRGHGDSDGNRFGFTYGADESKDVDAAVKYLSDTRGIRKIGAIGHSAGAVSIIISAARNPKIDAVVAAAPFPSMEEIWQNNRPSLMPSPLYDFTMWVSEMRKGFSRHQVRPKDGIPDISPRPVLLIHGTNDKRIPVEQVLYLYNLANQPKALWLVDGASHSGIRYPVLDKLMGDITAFFDDALLGVRGRITLDEDIRNLVVD